MQAVFRTLKRFAAPLKRAIPLFHNGPRTLPVSAHYSPFVVSKKGIAAQLYHTQAVAARTQLPGPTPAASFIANPLAEDRRFGLAAALDYPYGFINAASPKALKGEATLIGVIERREQLIRQLEKQLYEMRMEKLSLLAKMQEIPRQFICPISLDVMVDPVVAADGHTYERAAIEAWLETHNTSPMTREPLAHKNVVPNVALRTMIVDFQQERKSLQEAAENAAPARAMQPTTAPGITVQ